MTIEKTEIKIYHIPNVKVGQTNNIERRMKELGHSDYEVLLTIEPNTQSMRTIWEWEVEFQKKYGFKPEHEGHYENVVRSRTKDQRGENNPMYGKQGFFNKKHTAETLQKMTESKLGENNPRWGRTTYKCISPDGEISIVSGGVKKWATERGLDVGSMRKVAIGKYKSHKGWKFEILEETNNDLS